MDPNSVFVYAAAALAVCASTISIARLGRGRRRVDSSQIRRQGYAIRPERFRTTALRSVLVSLALVPALPAQNMPQADTQAVDFLFKMPNGWRQGWRATASHPAVPLSQASSSAETANLWMRAFSTPIPRRQLDWWGAE